MWGMFMQQDNKKSQAVKTWLYKIYRLVNSLSKHYC
jgi:hypothetical protein